MHRASLRKRFSSYAAVPFIAIAFVAGALVAVATTPFGAVPAHAQSPGTDYHLEAFGDPMDFSNAEDHVIADEAMLFRTTSASISDGQLHFDASGGAHFSPLWAGYPTGIPHGREGGLRPIDAGRYQRLVMRMNAPGGVTVIVRWFSCIESNDRCSGGHAFTTQDGWQTYDVPLVPNTPDAVLSQPFSGSIVGLRVVVAPGGPAHFDVDWVRVVPNGLSPVDELVGGAPPPPTPSDKLDYATFAGNPWDWDGPGDASPVGIRNVVVGNGRFAACNTPVAGTAGFPGIVFALPGGLPIDASRFKTLTVEYRYDGPFSTKTGPGGGAVARVFWTDARGRHPTKGIHLYPNESYFQIRLDDPRSVSDSLERGVATGAPWGGSVKEFRLNANQDPGGRCWSIGRVWLSADEPAGAAAPATAAAAAAAGARPAGAGAVSSAKTTKKAAKKSKSPKTTKKASKARR